MSIQICSMRIQNTLEATSACILHSYAEFGTFFCCYSDIMEAPSVALCTFRMYRELLNVIQNMAGAAPFHIGA